MKLCAFTDAEWLETVAANRHQSPNHELCCRLLSHIPLLAAYTGWPTETQLSHYSQAGAEPSQTTNGDGGADVTERSNSDSCIKTGPESDDQAVKWKPLEEDKKYIEETVRSLVDSEDLCRLLMIAMATELEKPTNWERGDQSDCSADKSSRHVVRSFVGDADHGDSMNHLLGKREQPESKFSVAQKDSAAVIRHVDEQLTRNVGCDLASAGDNDDGAQRYEIRFDSPGTGRITPSPTTTTPPDVEITSKDASVSIGDANSASLSQNNSNSCRPEKAYRIVVPASNSVNAETMAAPAKNATMEIREEYYQFSQPYSLQTLNNASRRTVKTQTVDKSELLLERSLVRNLQALSTESSVDHPKQGSAGNKSPGPDNEIALPAKNHQPPPAEKLHLLAMGCTANDAINARAELATNGNVAATEPQRSLLDFRVKREEHEDKSNRGDPVNAVPDTLPAENKTWPGKSVEKQEPKREGRAGGVDDECKVTFRPQQSRLPLPVRTINYVSPAVASAASAASLRPPRTSPSTTPGLAQSVGRGRRPRSTPHDVKCALRRKNVAV